MVHHLYGLWGIGCRERNKKKTIGDVVYYQRCNKNLNQTVTNIGMRCFGRKEILDSYTKKVLREVEVSLDDPSVQSVHVIAHSYGGYVCAEIVYHLGRHPQSHKLNMVTFGSIFLLEPKEYRGLRFRQYMNKGDISMRCNTTYKGVRWLRARPRKYWWDEIFIHNDYPLDETRDNIIKKLNSS